MIPLTFLWSKSSPIRLNCTIFLLFSLIHILRDARIKLLYASYNLYRKLILPHIFRNLGVRNMDHMLISSWFHLHSSVPLSYVQPPESRPGTVLVASGKTIPVIDLGAHDRAETLRHILRASEQYGFFQVYVEDLLSLTMFCFLFSYLMIWYFNACLIYLNFGEEFL